MLIGAFSDLTKVCKIGTKVKTSINNNKGKSIKVILETVHTTLGQKK
nr:hypothetical protein [Mycoplasmopsis bovis]